MLSSVFSFSFSLVAIDGACVDVRKRCALQRERARDARGLGTCDCCCTRILAMSRLLLLLNASRFIPCSSALLTRVRLALASLQSDVMHYLWGGKAKGMRSGRKTRRSRGRNSTEAMQAAVEVKKRSRTKEETKRGREREKRKKWRMTEAKRRRREKTQTEKRWCTNTNRGGNRGNEGGRKKEDERERGKL